MSTQELDGTVALVVGAGPGVGRACALAYAESGADVVVAARRAEPLAALAAEVAAATGRRVEAVTVDLADAASCVALVDTAVESRPAPRPGSPQSCGWRPRAGR